MSGMPVTNSLTDVIQYDVVLVGGSPSNLALAHRLLDLAAESGQRFSIAVLEKAKEFGAHICSGAVVEPSVFKELFPNYEADKLPIEGVCDKSYFSVLGKHEAWTVPNLLLPEGLRKEGYWILSLSMVVGWMAKQLKAKAEAQSNVVVDLFPGFSAHEVLYDGNRVIGVSVVEDMDNCERAQDNAVYGRVVCFGDKGFISGDLIKKFNLRENPQLWSVGVKEVWKLPEGRAYDGQVWHTMGAPLLDGSFGGGFIYGMKANRLAVGLIVSLDSPNPNLNPQQLLQEYKKHPMLQKMLQGASLQKYGAALLPEGGYYSLPRQFSVDGALLVGDALGVLDVSSLNGVANSMETGLAAAKTIHDCLLAGSDFTANNLKSYRDKVLSGKVGDSLKNGRYFRQIWQENPRLLGVYLPEVVSAVDKKQPLAGFLNVGLKHNPFKAITDATRMGMKLEALWDLGRPRYEEDHKHIKPDYRAPLMTNEMTNGKAASVAKDTIYTREDAVFYAGPRYHHGNRHIDEFNAEVCMACIKTYDAVNREVPCVSDCTAEVHRVDKLGENGTSRKIHAMSLENCIQCRTCEIVCPEQNLKVRATEQGAGPDFIGL